MLEETSLTAPPPLSACYGRMGEPGRVPSTGTRSKRILHGALTVWSGEGLLLRTTAWGQEPHQYFLRMIRAQWRGGQIVRCEDRGSPQTAADSLEVAGDLAMERRFLPTAPPELTALEQLWRRVKGRTVASRATQSLAASADEACQYIWALRPHERLQQAGVLSGNFWLTT